MVVTSDVNGNETGTVKPGGTSEGESRTALVANFVLSPNFDGVVTCHSCGVQKFSKDVWWCRDCAVGVCSTCNLLRGHTEHRTAVWSPKELAQSCVRALQERCQRRINRAAEEESAIREYIAQLEESLISRVDKRLRDSNEPDLQRMGHLCSSFKLDPVTFGPASTSGVNTAGFYGRGRFSNGPVRSISSSPTIGENGRLSSASSPLMGGGSSTSRLSIYTRPPPAVDVDRRISVTLNELAKVDPAIAQNGSLENSSSLGTVRSRSGSQNLMNGIISSSEGKEFTNLKEIPVEDFVRTVEAKLNLAQEEQQTQPTDLTDRSFTSSNLSTSTPVTQMSPVGTTSGHRSSAHDETLMAPINSSPSPVKPVSPQHPIPIDANVNIICTAPDVPTPSERRDSNDVIVIINGEEVQKALKPYQTYPADEQPSCSNDNFMTGADRFSRAPSRAGPSDSDDITDGTKRTSSLSVFKPKDGFDPSSSVATAYHFGTDYLTRPIDVAVLGDGNHLAVSDSCGGVYIVVPGGEVVQQIWTEGGSASSVYYLPDKQQLLVSVMRRDEQRVIQIYDEKTFKMVGSVMCPLEPDVNLTRTRWIAATRVGDMYVASGDNKLSALWKYDVARKTWTTITTQKKSRYQYVSLIEDHPVKDNVVVITTDGVSGSLVVLYVTPFGKLQAEYNLSDMWGMSNSIKNPASAVYDEYGNLLIVDYNSGRIWLLTSSSGTDGPSGDDRATTPTNNSPAKVKPATRGRLASFRLRRKAKEKDPSEPNEHNSKSLPSDRKLKIVHEIGSQSGIGLAATKGWCYVASFATKRVIAFKYLDV